MVTLSCKARILQAIVDRIAAVAVPTIDGLTVDRDRSTAVDTDEIPIAVVFDNGDIPNGDWTGERGYSLLVNVEGAATGETDKEASDKANELEARVQQAVLADQSLGLGSPGPRLIEENPEPPPARLLVTGAQPTAGFNRGFVVEFATQEADPFTFA